MRCVMEIVQSEFKASRSRPESALVIDREPKSMPDPEHPPLHRPLTLSEEANSILSPPPRQQVRPLSTANFFLVGGATSYTCAGAFEVVARDFSRGGFSLIAAAARASATGGVVSLLFARALGGREI